MQPYVVDYDRVAEFDDKRHCPVFIGKHGSSSSDMATTTSSEYGILDMYYQSSLYLLQHFICTSSAFSYAFISL